MKTLRILAVSAIVGMSMTACLKDKSAEQAPAEQVAPAAPTQAPAQDATAPAPTEAAPAAAPADAGSTQSNH